MTDGRIEEVARYSVRSGIVHTPTLVFLWTNSTRDHHGELIDATAAHLLPRLFMDVAWRPRESIRLGGTRTPATQQKLRAAYQRALEVVALFHERGVLIQAGTDTGSPFLIPGASLVQEIGLLTDAGLDNESALAAATTIPGKLLGLNATGLIKAGAPADLLVLRKDPTIDISALDEIETVIADGRIYPSEFLESEIERYRQHHLNFSWDTLLPIAASLLR
jgi:imidazolonepropionase-like amidohydrolase